VISLKDMFYEASQSLIGICRDVGTNSSRSFTLDLEQFDGKGSEKQGQKRASVSESTPPNKRQSLPVGSPADSTVTFEDDE
jgi:hypothetical protein